jgi:hypothetical protein
MRASRIMEGIFLSEVWDTPDRGWLLVAGIREHVGT